MLFSFPEINLFKEKKKKEKKNPQSFRGIRNQFQETLPTLMVNVATESKCFLLRVCVGLSFSFSFIQKHRKKSVEHYKPYCWNTTLQTSQWWAIFTMAHEQARSEDMGVSPVLEAVKLFYLECSSAGILGIAPWAQCTACPICGPVINDCAGKNGILGK